MKLAVVIPAYNESERIAAVLADLLAHEYTHCIVVDDCSADETAKIALEHGAIVLKHIVNRGQGAALQTGTRYAIEQAYDYIVHFDADGQMQAADIPALLAPLHTGQADIALGSRYIKTRDGLPLFKKYFIHPVGRIINVLFTGLWLTDAHCGFRAMTAQAAQKITITQDGMAHSSEILERIHEHNVRFVEIPVNIIYHEYGQGLSGGVRIVYDLLKAKFFK